MPLTDASLPSLEPANVGGVSAPMRRRATALVGSSVLRRGRLPPRRAARGRARCVEDGIRVGRWRSQNPKRHGSPHACRLTGFICCPSGGVEERCQRESSSRGRERRRIRRDWVAPNTGAMRACNRFRVIGEMRRPFHTDVGKARLRRVDLDIGSRRSDPVGHILWRPSECHDERCACERLVCSAAWAAPTHWRNSARPHSRWSRGGTPVTRRTVCARCAAS